MLRPERQRDSFHLNLASLCLPWALGFCRTEGLQVEELHGDTLPNC